MLVRGSWFCARAKESIASSFCCVPQPRWSVGRTSCKSNGWRCTRRRTFASYLRTTARMKDSSGPSGTVAGTLAEPGAGGQARSSLRQRRTAATPRAGTAPGCLISETRRVPTTEPVLPALRHGGSYDWPPRARLLLRRSIRFSSRGVDIQSDDGIVTRSATPRPPGRRRSTIGDSRPRSRPDRQSMKRWLLLRETCRERPLRPSCIRTQRPAPSTERTRWTRARARRRRRIGLALQFHGDVRSINLGTPQRRVRSSRRRRFTADR